MPFSLNGSEKLAQFDKLTRSRAEKVSDVWFEFEELCHTRSIVPLNITNNAIQTNVQNNYGVVSATHQLFAEVQNTAVMANKNGPFMTLLQQ